MLTFDGVMDTICNARMSVLLTLCCKERNEGMRDKSTDRPELLLQASVQSVG